MFFTVVVGTEYICGNSHCSWKDYVEHEDWGYYSRTNGNCTLCQDKCNHDRNCGGVECGGIYDYCGWWKEGSCGRNNVNYIDDNLQTCFKVTDGESPF